MEIETESGRKRPSPIVAASVGIGSLVVLALIYMGARDVYYRLSLGSSQLEAMRLVAQADARKSLGQAEAELALEEHFAEQQKKFDVPAKGGRK